MDVTTDTIRHIAKLARLSLTEAEVEAFVPQFQEILGLFAELDAVDV
ncbi:Asp-tRNA(Asn)/Glu-tRNA(Gln) amidotransferase GatCAB subunit C, partial [Candidatus Woesearchaeota archaeon CG_4_10_14_0_2_um_filter_57_5]